MGCAAWFWAAQIKVLGPSAIPIKWLFFFFLLDTWLQCYETPMPFSSVQFSRSVVSNSLQPHGSQHARPRCRSPTPIVHSNLHPSSRWCHPASHPLSPFPPAPNPSQYQSLFQWVSSSQEVAKVTGVSALASFLPKNTQGWSLGWPGWISLQSKGLSRVFSNTTVQKHQFFDSQLSSQSNSALNVYYYSRKAEKYWANGPT